MDKSAFPCFQISADPGLTKREWFAGLAMSGLLSSFEDSQDIQSESTVAEWSVGYADALIAELAKESR